MKKLLVAYYLFFLLMVIQGCLDVRTPELPKLNPSMPDKPGLPYNPTPPAGTVLDPLSSAEYKRKAGEAQARADAAEKAMRLAQDDRRDALGDRDAAIAEASRAENREFVHTIRIWLAWFGGLSAVLAIACIVIREWPGINLLPGATLLRMARGFVYGAVGFFTLAYAAAFAISVIKWALIVAGVMGMPIAVWYLVQWIRAEAAKRHVQAAGVAAMNALQSVDPLAHAAIIAEAKVGQVADGVRGLVDKVLDRVQGAADVITYAAQAKVATARLVAPAPVMDGPGVPVEHAPHNMTETIIAPKPDPQAGVPPQLRVDRPTPP